MRIFLPGASGLVGGAFARIAASQGHEIIGIVGRFRGRIPGLVRQVQLDLTDEATVVAGMKEARADAVVNCAAVSEPSECDADPARSHHLNVVLPGLLARGARESGSRLVHLSSEQVFAGDRAPYRTSDPVAPINRYGRQKAESEAVVLAAAAGFAAVVRAPLLTGNSLTGSRSVHERLLADWAGGRTPRLFTDEIRQVAHADNVATALLELCQRPDLAGVFHWAGLEPVSRYQLGLRLRDHFGLTPQQAPVDAVQRSDVPEASRNRPADLRLDLAPLANSLTTQPQLFAQQLEQLAIPRPCEAWIRTLLHGKGATSSH